jgi:hypothetical protein
MLSDPHLPTPFCLAMRRNGAVGSIELMVAMAVVAIATFVRIKL